MERAAHTHVCLFLLTNTPFAQITRAADSTQGCDEDCTASHHDGNCLKCGLGWGDHAGHNCFRAGGGRGSWAKPGASPTVRSGVACDSSCSKTHWDDGECLVCGNGYGAHSGHTCTSGGGGRGSWSAGGAPAPVSPSGSTGGGSTGDAIVVSGSESEVSNTCTSNTVLMIRALSCYTHTHTHTHTHTSHITHHTS
jgi:hypothetical protein